MGTAALGDLAIAAATVLAVFSMVPQLRRVWHTRDTNGVALSAATIGGVSELGWVHYTVGGGLWAAVPESVLAVVINVLLAASVIRAGAPVMRSVLATVSWTAALTVATLVGGRGTLGIVLSIAFAVELAPALWATYRSPSPTGVSPSSWAMLGIESVLWSAYGVAEGDAALVTLGLLGTGAAAAILLRIGHPSVTWRPA